MMTKKWAKVRRHSGGALARRFCLSMRLCAGNRWRTRAPGESQDIGVGLLAEPAIVKPMNRLGPRYRSPLGTLGLPNGAFDSVESQIGAWPDEQGSQHRFVPLGPKSIPEKYKDGS